MKLAKARKGHHEVWHLKLNDRTGNRALWLRFTLLVTKNGFMRVAETWALSFQREQNGEIGKLAVKQSYPIASFSRSDEGVIQIGENLLSKTETRGKVQAKGRTIQWDLRLRDLQDKPVNLVPEGLKRLGIVKNDVWADSENLVASGTVTIDGVSHEFSDAAGMQGHVSGPKNAHSWIWGQANAFVDEKGEPAHFIFDGVTTKARLTANLASPRISSFYFFYDGKSYQFNSVWDALHLKSESTITEWSFQADRGEISFRGTANADHKDFAGLTYEDTDGSLLYCANSKLSDMKVHVYRRGKLEATFLAKGTATFEVVSRRKNPYVKFLI